jgi:predicted TIM-barrel fold metal-dependent hydrolase
MRTITLEEHFATPAFLDGPMRELKENILKAGPRGARIIEQLSDIGEGRLAEMDAAGIDMQVISLNAPGTEQLPDAEALTLARDSNKALAAAVKKHPKRLAGFAALPTALPDKAADELQRTVEQHGFRGALINGHVRGRYLDDKYFWPIFERAVKLDVPIYLHPTRPPQAVIEASYGGFSPQVSYVFSASGWGWHIETAIHVIRLILGGVFDRFPQLQLVVGHLGEGLPFMLYRLNDQTRLAAARRGLKKTPAQYLTENVVVTCSGNFSAPAFICTVMALGIDNVLFSVDWPYESNAGAVDFLRHLPLAPRDMEKIAHLNAERVLRL